MASPFQSPFQGFSGIRSPFQSPFAPRDPRRIELGPQSGLTPEQQQLLVQRLAEADFTEPAPAEPEESFVGRMIPDIVEKAASQIGESLIYTLPGLAYAGMEVGKDIGDLVTEGDFTPERTGNIFKAMGTQIVEDFRNPGENPGYLLMDLFGLASLGAGTAARTANAARAARLASAARKGGDLPEPPPPPPLGWEPPKGSPPGGAPAAPSPHGAPPQPDVVPPQPRALSAAERADMQAQARRPDIEPPLSARTDLADDPNAPPELLRQLGVVAEPQPVLPPALTRNAPELRREIPDMKLKFKGIMSKEGTSQGIQGIRAEGFPDLDVRPVGPGQWRLHEKGEPFGGIIIDPSGKNNPKLAMKHARDELEAVIRERVYGKHPAEDPSLAALPDPLPGREPSYFESPGKATVVTRIPDGRDLAPGAGAMSPEDALLRAIEELPPEAVRAPDAPPPVLPPAPGRALDAPEPGPAQAVADPRLEPVPPAAPKGLRESGTSPRQLGISPRQLSRAMPDVPDEVRASIAADIRNAATAAGKAPGPKQRLEILQKYMEPDVAKEVLKRQMNESKKISGGADVGMETVIRDTLRAFAAPRLPGTMKIENFDPFTPEGQQLLASGQEHLVADVLLSRNPLVASLQRVQSKAHQARQGKRGERLIGLGSTREGTIRRAKGEADRIATAVEAAGLPATIRELVEMELQAPRKKGAGELIDTTNQFAKIMALYMKPAYVPANLIGQWFLTLAHHSWNPVNVARSANLQRKVFDRGDIGVQRAEKIRAAMGTHLYALTRQEMAQLDLPKGAIQALHYESGASRRVGALYRGLSETFNKVLDTPFRDNAFINTARQFGYTTPEQLARLIDAMPDKDGVAKVGPGTRKLQSDFMEIARRANRDIIDYGRLGPMEKRILRRVIFFYPWFKGASIYGAHWAAERPAQMLAMVNQAQATAEDDPLGPVPSWMKGFIKVGEREVPGVGAVPQAINTAAATVLGTPGETIEALTNVVAGGGGEANQLSQFLTPALSAAISAMTGTDTFTGRNYPAQMGGLEIAAQELMQTFAPARAMENWRRAEKIESGELDPSDLLYLRNRRESAGQFLTGITPIAYNPREARDRAVAEERSLFTRKDATLSLAQDKRAQWEGVAAQLGLGPMPPSVRQAFDARAERDAEIAAAARGKPSFSQLDRLQVELGLLVRKGEIEEDWAREILTTVGTQHESRISSFRRRLNDRFFGAELLSRYRLALRDRGGEPESL